MNKPVCRQGLSKLLLGISCRVKKKIPIIKSQACQGLDTVQQGGPRRKQMAHSCGSNLGKFSNRLFTKVCIGLFEENQQRLILA